MLDEILKVIFDRADKQELIYIIERLISITIDVEETKKWVIKEFDKSHYVLEKLLQVLEYLESNEFYNDNKN